MVSSQQGVEYLGLHLEDLIAYSQLAAITLNSFRVSAGHVERCIHYLIHNCVLPTKHETAGSEKGAS